MLQSCRRLHDIRLSDLQVVDQLPGRVGQIRHLPPGQAERQLIHRRFEVDMGAPARQVENKLFPQFGHIIHLRLLKLYYGTVGRGNQIDPPRVLGGCSTGSRSI